MTILSPKPLLSGLRFPEGPRWHEGRLWFSDFHQHRVMAVDLKGKAEVIAELDDRPSGLGFLPSGDLLVSLMRTRRIVQRATSGVVREYAGLASFAPGFINDMVVDSRGRAYIGGLWPVSEGERAPRDVIVLVTPDGKARVAADGLQSPNGAVITPDGQTLIIGETGGHRLTAFDIAADGSLSNRRVFAQLDASRNPDGICLDAEGAVWVACFGTPDFLRVTQGGTVTDRIECPDRWAVACMLGGPERRTLFLLTARLTREHMRSLKTFQDDFNSQSLGWIETVPAEVPGAGLP